MNHSSNKLSRYVLLFGSVFACILTVNFISFKANAKADECELQSVQFTDKCVGQNQDINLSSNPTNTNSQIVQQLKSDKNKGKSGNKRHYGRKSGFSFALVGDLPYATADSEEVPVKKFDNVIKEINNDDKIRFTVHVGDIKSGGKTCDDQRITARYNQLQTLRQALIYTPGDNEWTDCHRESNGKFNPIERLDFIRKIFFSKPGFTLGQRPFKVETQSSNPTFKKYVENVIFERRKIVFSTIHVVGSNNNLAPWSGIDSNDSFENPRADRKEEFDQRLEAALNWLDKTFDRAQEIDAKGVFVIIHANPRFDLESEENGRAGFNAFLTKLQERTLQYKKPVILAHGDFHEYLVDKPFANLPNFTRVQTFGSSQVHWIKVNVEPKSGHVFSFIQKIVPENVDTDS
ncbi:MAG: hypothetical protein QNJ36_19745 [Calothrix sp. MO_167.B42]|nr:hypothetical protein [Calothrix sp. MO_167.B42]